MVSIRFIRLCLLAFVLVTSSFCLSGVAAAKGKVKVAYYVEAYCPRCIDVLTNSLADAVKRVGAIMDLEVVPFGNGSEKNGAVTCQHGERECHANTLQGCAMKYYPHKSIWFPWLVCMEKADDPLGGARKCARRSKKIDFEKIEKCATSQEGKDILYKNARKTLDLRPENKYVPWITVNGKPFEDPENIVAAICSQYTWGDKQKYCSDTSRYPD
jgi:interferon gamma-inducible protein 30